MSDVNALMDKLKSTVNYKQFDAPRASEQAWPVLEKMARAKSALSRPDLQVVAPAASVVTPAVSVEVEPAAPVQPVQPVAPPAAAPVFATEAPANGSLFDRLQVDSRAQGGDEALLKSAAFSRYGAAKTVETAPQALSEIFERIGRKAI